MLTFENLCKFEGAAWLSGSGMYPPPHMTYDMYPPPHTQHGSLAVAPSLPFLVWFMLSLV